MSCVACFRTGEETEQDGVQEVVGHVHSVWQHHTVVAYEEQQVSHGQQAASCIAREECDASDT